MKKINDLNELLAGLTKSGKASLIGSLAGIVEIPADEILESIDTLVADGNYGLAAHIAEQAYTSTKDKDERKKYALAILKVGKIKNTLLQSADFVRDSGFPELALETYEAFGYFDSARAAAEKAGLKEKAEFYSRINKILEEEGLA